MEVMKQLPYLTLAIFAATLPLVDAYESKRTAEYILASPADFEGKEVTLDVSFVQPVHWKSPVPELAFFHAITIDRVDKKRGGHILVAIPAADAAKFAKKFGMDFDGKNNSDTLHGTLVTAPGKGLRPKVWIIDTTGKIQDLVKNQKIALEDGRDMNGGGEGPGAGPARPRNKMRFR